MRIVPLARRPAATLLAALLAFPASGANAADAASGICAGSSGIGTAQTSCAGPERFPARPRPMLRKPDTASGTVASPTQQSPDRLSARRDAPADVVASDASLTPRILTFADNAMIAGVPSGNAVIADRFGRRDASFVPTAQENEPGARAEPATDRTRAPTQAATGAPPFAAELATLLLSLVSGRLVATLRIAPNAPGLLAGIAAAAIGKPDASQPMPERFGAVAAAATTGSDVEPAPPASRTPVLAERTPAQKIALADCNRLAADPDDPAMPAGVEGVKNARDIDAARAVPACEAALAAAPNDVQTVFHLGRALLAAGRSAEAAARFKAAAAGGQPAAAYEYASALLDGSGVPRDPAAAIEVLKPVADRLPFARALLGWMLVSGEGVPKDAPAGIATWQKGADAREPASAFYLGVEYANGVNVPADYRRAETLLAIASEGGEPAGTAELGKLYFRGSLGTPDYPRAFQLLSQAADAGNLVGRANRGMMRATGTGTGRDRAGGAEDLLAALKGGDPDAAGYLIDNKGEDFDAEFRRIVQRTLRRSGVFDGSPNGVFGESTLAALDRYRNGEGRETP